MRQQCVSTGNTCLPSEYIKTQRAVFFPTPGSDNKNAAYALKGAITSALGNAVSNLGFQEQVYLGKRDHNTVRGKPTTQSAPSVKAETLPCPIHHVPMREYPKKDGKGKYFAHKDGDKWCYGTAEKKTVAA